MLILTKQSLHMLIIFRMNRHRFSIRRVTHVGQNLRGDALQIRNEFVGMMNASINNLAEGTLSDISWDRVGNMDQTPIYFEPANPTVVNNIGASTVAVRSNGQGKIRATVALTIFANGTKAPPMIIFKGKPGAKVDKEVRAFSSLLPFPAFCIAQDNAWQDATNMQEYVSMVSYSIKFMLLMEKSTQSLYLIY